MNALTRKLGPLPVWAWLAILAAVGVWWWRRRSSTPGMGIVETTPQPVAAGAAAATPDGSLGLAPSAGAPSDTGQTTSDLLSAYGSQQTGLLQALEAANQDVLGLASSQIQAAQTGTALGSFSTQTQPLVYATPAPGVSGFGYSAPGLVTTPSSPPPAQTAARSSAAGTGGTQPFGGIVSTRRLQNGATLTTYASGRQVEQVPGKSPYVVRR